MDCANCGSPTTYKKGEKNGRPWAGYFCQNKDCKFVNWVDNKPKESRPLPPRPQRPEPNWDEINARKEEGMEWLNAKNNAAVIIAALIRSGKLQADDWEKHFKNATKIIFEFQEAGGGTK